MVLRTSPVKYAFASCVVDTGAREVRLNGVSRPVAPRVFDLLVYLLEHRERVVTRDELLDCVWRGAVLSESVLARAVMKARHAIGDLNDTSDGPTLIRTVNRVGYRFVAVLTVLDIPSPGASVRSSATPGEALQPAVGTSPEPGKLRFAILPFDDRTGDRRLSWVELGLMSLVTQALEADGRLHVEPVASVLTALEASRTDPPSDESKARWLAKLIGIQCVCGVTVTVTEAGFAFDYRVMTESELKHAGRLEGVELTAMSRQLILRIETHLLSGDAGELRLQSEDPWANQAFARAMHALQLKNGESALKLIQVVLDLEPDNKAVRHALLAIYCQLGRPDSLALGESLLREALSAEDSRSAAELHCMLAVATSRLHGETPAARHHIEEAVRLAGRVDSSYWAQHIYNEAANAAHRRGDCDLAQSLYEQVESASRLTGNGLQRLIAVSGRGVIEAVQGNLVTARSLWESCLHEFEALRQRNRVMLIRCNLAELCAAMGLLTEATQHADALLALLPSGQIRWFNVQCLSMICIRYAEARLLDRIENALVASGVLIDDAGGRDLANSLVAVSQRHLCQTDYEAANRKLRSAIDLIVPRNDSESASMWVPLLIHNEMRAGHYERAHDLALELLSAPSMNAPTELAGMRLHAHAFMLHARGNVVGARAALTEALEVMPPSRWSILVRLDAAWLELERDDPDAARRVLVGTFFWLQSHPVGQIVDARLHLALGDRHRASVILQRCVEFFAPDDAYPTRLLACCRQPDEAVPTSPRLPSVM